MSKTSALFEAIGKIMHGLEGIAPSVFQAEFGVLVGYAVILFNLHIDDTKKAALLGVGTFIFMAVQWATKQVEASIKYGKV